MAPPVAFMSTRAKVDFSTSKEYFDWIFARFAVNNTPAVAKLRSLCELAKERFGPSRHLQLKLRANRALSWRASALDQCQNLVRHPRASPLLLHPPGISPLPVP